MTGSPGGVRLVGVRAGSPAERAGFKAGDVITGMAGKTVANLIDMTEVLRSHQPGDSVIIAVMRDNAAIQLNAVLGKRGGS
jgi:S1-C subfamily serine protease